MRERKGERKGVKERRREKGGEREEETKGVRERR